MKLKEKQVATILYLTDNSVLLDIAALAGGLILLTLGADGLVCAAVALARKFGLSSLVIGIVIVGFGTSLPELAVSVNAMLDNAPDIALGNVIGSNTANVLLILGLATLIRTIAAPRSLYLRDLGVMMVASLVILCLGWTGSLEWISGLVMVTILVAYLGAALTRGESLSAGLDEDVAVAGYLEQAVWRTAVYAIGGLAGLLIGASLMVSGAVGISRTLGMSEAVIGLTVVAVGTSLPELAAALAAVYRKQTEMVLGNIIGSNIFNIFGILGISSMVGTIPVSDQMAYIDVPVMLATALLLALVIIVLQRIGRITGIAMLVGYVGYVAYLFSNHTMG